MKDNLAGAGQKEKYSTGATRNKIAPVRYDLIKWDFIRELAMVMAEGAKSHGEPGSDGNWEKGLPKSSTINHMFEHWHKYLEGDRGEPHLAKMAFALMALWHYERKGIDVKR